MSDKNLYINDLLHRFPGHTFTETPIESMVNVVFLDSGSQIIGEAKKLVAIDAYSAIRSDLLKAQRVGFLSSTSERDALVNLEISTRIDNLTNGFTEKWDGTAWSSVGGETGGIIRRKPKTIQTTDNTQTILDSLTIEDNTLLEVSVKVSGETPDHSATATFNRQVAAKRFGGGGVELVGAVNDGPDYKNPGAGGWGVDFIVSSNDLEVVIKGQNLTIINWRSFISSTKF